MEDIKTNFDKIMEQYNDSVTHSAPKKLSFGVNDDSLNSIITMTKKRRIADVSDSKANSSVDDSTFNNSIPMSPFERRHLQANLGEARSRIIQLESEIQSLRRVHNESQVLSEQKAQSLKDQCDFTAQKVSGLEKHLKTLRKREYESKQRALDLERELNAEKNNFDRKVFQLEAEKSEAVNMARQTEYELNRQISHWRNQSIELEAKLKSQAEEFELIQNQLEEYRDRVSSHDELKFQHEKLQQEFQSVNFRLKELESDIAEYKDWKEITKSSRERFLMANQKDTELQSLLNQKKRLQELVDNKLFLEAQVISMEPVVKRESQTQNENVALQAKLLTVEKELKEWIKVAQDHCLPNELVSPLALRHRIENLLKGNISIISEKNDGELKIKELVSQYMDYKHKADVYAKNIEELNVALRRHKQFKERVQKKLILVSKERDCYKQLLENFDKEMSVSNMNSTDISSMDQQMRLRIDMLEKTVSGYKEMCTNLEKELVNARQLPSNDLTLESAMSTEGYETLRKELDSLRLENERLLRRTQQLELELEHRCLKGDFNFKDHKMLHFKQNPADEAYQNSANLIEKLQADKERLKRRIKQLEEDTEATQQRFNETTNMTVNIKEMNQLRSELESTNQRMKLMKEAYKSSSMEFREVCYMLFGYRVDRIGASANYKISSMYAESPDDYMNFRLNESSVLELLETPYSATLQQLIETHLVGNASLPVFLSTLTLDLFQRSTITIS